MGPMALIFFLQGWVWAIAGICTVVGQLPYIGSGIFYVPGRPYDALENAIFFSAQRLIWAFIIGFMLVTHATAGFSEWLLLFLNRVSSLLNLTESLLNDRLVLN